MTRAFAIFLMIAISGVCMGVTPPASGPSSNRLFTEWDTFTSTDGLPSDHVLAVAVDDARVWVGTDRGLAIYEDGRWRSYGTEQGLVYPVIMALALDSSTGDCWIATMGGLSRYSGGRFENYTQLDSGLPNDVVYGIATQPPFVWAATAAGAGRLDTHTGSWDIFTKRNTPMHEIWCYHVVAVNKAVYIAVWGGGVLEYNAAQDRWIDYRDPDGEMELDLRPDDGPTTDVVASVAYGQGILWVGTYFGANRYDGRTWSSYYQMNSGLPSDFVNIVVADGASAWFGTDSGLAEFDGKTWTTYHATSGGGGRGARIAIRQEGGQTTEVRLPTGPADDFVRAVARRGDELWVATGKGLSRGRVGHQLGGRR